MYAHMYTYVCVCVCVQCARPSPRSSPAFIGASVYDEYSGSIKITTHLGHISHCETASGTNRSNRWTQRVLIINTRRDEIHPTEYDFREENHCSNYHHRCPKGLN